MEFSDYVQLNAKETCLQETSPPALTSSANQQNKYSHVAENNRENVNSEPVFRDIVKAFQILNATLL